MAEVSDGLSKLKAFIALEGLDGVGKTCAARGLARRLDAELFEFPPVEYRQTGNIIVQDPRLLSYVLFLLSGAAALSEKASRSRQFRPVVADRYVLSALAYGHSITRFADVQRTFRQSFEMPSLTVLLTTREDVRRARIVRRGGRDLVDDLLEQESYRKGVLAVYRKHALIECDTSDKTIEEVVDWIEAEAKRTLHLQS